ncbi:hypothetical protein GQ457_06G028020 [Hibiscus cannabinus]
MVAVLTNDEMNSTSNCLSLKGIAVGLINLDLFDGCVDKATMVAERTGGNGNFIGSEPSGTSFWDFLRTPILIVSKAGYGVKGCYDVPKQNQEDVFGQLFAW